LSCDLKPMHPPFQPCLASSYCASSQRNRSGGDDPCEGFAISLMSNVLLYIRIRALSQSLTTFARVAKRLRPNYLQLRRQLG
jgi:hypothetical protein